MKENHVRPRNDHFIPMIRVQEVKSTMQEVKSSTKGKVLTFRDLASRLSEKKPNLKKNSIKSMDFSNKKKFFDAKNEEIKKISPKKHTRSQFSFLKKKNIGYFEYKEQSTLLNSIQINLKAMTGD